MGWTDNLPAHVSYSQLGTWNDCQMKYVLSKVYKPPETPAWYFMGGTAFHEATEWYDRLVVNDNRPAPGDLMDTWTAIFDREILEAERIEPNRAAWQRGGRVTKEFPEKEVEAFYRSKAPEWLALYDAQSQDSGESIFITDQGEPGIELAFTVLLGGVPVLGAIDRVYVHPSRTVGIRDIKTGSSAGNSLQLGLYAVAAEQFLGIRPAFGSFWNPRKGGAQAPVPLDRYTTALFDQMYGAMDAQRKSGHIVPNLGSGCERCNVKEYCPAYGGSKAIEIGMP